MMVVWRNRIDAEDLGRTRHGNDQVVRRPGRSSRFNRTGQELVIVMGASG